MEEQAELIRRAKKGDAEAFGRLYQEIYKDLYRFACYTLGNPTDAQDVVGDTVADAFVGIRKLRKEEAFRGWMFRILSNKCKRQMGVNLKRNDGPSEEMPLSKAGGGGMDDVAEQLLVRELFFKLEDLDRLILSMHLFAGYSGKEIAKYLKMNENTVRSRESRALKRLRMELQED